MARRRGKKDGKETCPICGSSVNKLDKHVERRHPDVWEETKIDALREALEKEPLSDEEKLDAAVELFEMGEFNMVLEMLKHIEPSFPDMGYVFDIVGQALSQLEDFNGAEHFMRRAVALEPDIPEMRFNLALTLGKNAKLYAGLEELEKIDISRVEPENRDMIRKTMDFMNGEMEHLGQEKGVGKEQAALSYRTFIEGYELMLAAEYEKSIEKFREVLTIEPDAYMAFGNMGSAYVKLGDYKKARQYLEKSLSINPDYVYAINNLKYLKKRESGESSGVGLSLEPFTEDERKMVPATEIIGDNLETVVNSTAFYRTKDPERVRSALENHEEFDIVEQEEGFVEAIWFRENPDHILKDEMPGFPGSPVSVLGNLTLRLDDLKLETMSLGRLRILQNVLLDKCDLGDVLEPCEEYFEELWGPQAEEEEEEEKGTARKGRRGRKRRR